MKQIKNVQLISPDNQFYKLYQMRFKNEKPQKEVLSKKVVAKSQTISWVLEKVTQAWIKLSGKMQDERIIMYELHYGKNKFTRLFKELDYVLKFGNKLIIGELKVSNDNPRGRASKQTYESSKLIKHITENFEIQVIWIDLCPQYSREETSVFNTDFSKSKFQLFDYMSDERCTYKHKINFLHIDVKDIFSWGVVHKLIKTPELLLATLEESDIVGRVKLLKQEIQLLRNDLRGKSENEATKIESKIADIRNIIAIEKVKLELIQKGYIVQKYDTKQAIFENYKRTILHLENQNCCDFQTEHPKDKYIVFSKCHITEIQLLDAEKIWHRLSDKSKQEIETVWVNFGGDKFSIISIEGRRRFAYGIDKINNSQKSIGGLIEFQHIIDNSEPIKIQLQEDEVLIINNWRMLYKIKEKIAV
jgi:hypothetical protein